MFKRLALLPIMGLLLFSYSVFGQIAPTGQQRIVQPIIINGQQAEGVMVVQDGTVAAQICSSPQYYVTVDRSSSGWACFEPTTGMWLLHALPPRQTTYTYQQPQAYATAPAVSVYSYPYGYSYGYYPYYSYYPYIIGPQFGIGFGLRSGIIINRPIGIDRAVGMARPVVPFVVSRPFGGFRQAGRIGFGRIGHR